MINIIKERMKNRDICVCVCANMKYYFLNILKNISNSYTPAYITDT